MAKRYWVEIEGERIYRNTYAELKRLAQAAATRLNQALLVGYDDEVARPKPKKRRTTRRYGSNPMMQGVEFSGEQWVIKGIAPNGRKAVAYAATRAEAEDTADYLHANYRWRAITTRRVAAPRR
jgi:hypothetical protein